MLIISFECPQKRYARVSVCVSQNDFICKFNSRGLWTLVAYTNECVCECFSFFFVFFFWLLMYALPTCKPFMCQIYNVKHLINVICLNVFDVLFA